MVVLLSEYIFCALYFISLKEVCVTILLFFSIDTAQQAFTCSNSIIGTPEQHQKSVQS